MITFKQRSAREKYITIIDVDVLVISCEKMFSGCVLASKEMLHVYVTLARGKRASGRKKRINEK